MILWIERSTVNGWTVLLTSLVNSKCSEWSLSAQTNARKHFLWHWCARHSWSLVQV